MCVYIEKDKSFSNIARYCTSICFIRSSVSPPKRVAGRIRCIVFVEHPICAH